MALPLFPTEAGVPGDGNLVAIYGGSPASVEVIGGIIRQAQVVEAHPQAGATVPPPQGHFGEPLTGDGVTIWLSGSLHLDVHLAPTVSDYADLLARWATVRAKMLLASYELFLYYRTAAPATYRKYKEVKPLLVRSTWSDPVSLSYVLAAVSSDKTLYTTAPGA
jgi:hypothetical protein